MAAIPARSPSLLLLGLQPLVLQPLVLRPLVLRPLAWLLLALLWLAPQRASAQLFGPIGLDPHFCDQPSLRQTIVYVDDMMMVEGRTEWAHKLGDKLSATLSPGERVTVVRLQTETGRSSELWSGCWPDYTAEQRQKIAGQLYVFTESPIAQLDTQRKFFLQALGAAFGRIYNPGKRSPDTVRINASDPPPKQILRALASDDGRFANSRVTLRAILYSDLAEQSDLGSAFDKPPVPPPSYGEQLGSYLRRGVFYDFGLGEDVDGRAGFRETARAFWSNALRSMAASIGSIGSDLNLPGTIPVRAYASPVTLQFDGQDLDGRLSLLIGTNGDLVDSWIGISRLTSASLSGTFLCRGSPPICRLDATTNGGIATNSASESVTLTGAELTGMKGHLGVKGSRATYELTASPGGS